MEEKKEQMTNVTLEELKAANRVMEEVIKRSDEIEIENDILLNMVAMNYIKLRKMYKLFLINVAIYAVLIVAYFYKL